jgi:RNA polymerase sigma-70 factor (ECF subfamily)
VSGERRALQAKFADVRNAEPGSEMYRRLLGDLVNASLAYVERAVLRVRSGMQSRGEQDVLSHVQGTIVEKVGTINNPSGYVSWLRTVADNQKTTLARKDKRTRIGFAGDALSIADYREGLDAIKRRQAIAELLATALEELRKEDAQLAQIVSLRYLQEKTSAEVARDLNMADGTVRSKLYKARKFLREFITRSGLNQSN